LEVEELIPEMTRTLTAKAGDKLIINFGCSGHGTGYDESEVVLTYRIKVNGATIEPDKRVQGGYVPYYYEAVMYVGVNMVRFYEVPADGDYTITVTWRDDSGSDPGYRIPGNRRQMIIQHLR